MKRMKLRIKGNSLRLRITPSELNCLLEIGRIEETISFAPDENARLTYALEHHADVPAMRVCYSPQEIAVVVSSQEIRRWAAAQDVGLYGEVPNSCGGLELAVEKDFACLDKNDAENADTFPNPHLGTIC
jgi:Family of unknown function (DUF7009)